MLLSSQEVAAFQKKILEWYEKNQRALPWRENRDPYRILISEVMLQQTQVNRVIEKYQEWMLAFPTLESLAQASTRDVLSHWSGLGYNRRALFLHQLAQFLVEKSKKTVVLEQSDRNSAKQKNVSPSEGSYQGLQPFQDDILWPQTEKELQSLPGIGKYTSRALLCFAFDHQVAVVDTNIKKIILTQFSGLENATEKEIEEIATALLPARKAYEWNQALMDYASAELKSIVHPRVTKQKPFQQVFHLDS